MPHRRAKFAYALRYRPGSRMARRRSGPAKGRFSLADAENLRTHCQHADQIEVVRVRWRAPGDDAVVQEQP